MKGLILISFIYQNYKPLDNKIISMIYFNIQNTKHGPRSYWVFTEHKEHPEQMDAKNITLKESW